ncbi:MAG: alpha/beta hydrolase [Muribaculaceae bacterium]|nr:alpha/beta hydrolase [Muribaculaceae bacterium]
MAMVIAVAAVTTLAASVYFMDYALGRDSRTDNEAMEHVLEQAPHVRPWIDSLQHTAALRDTFITHNGLRLHAWWVPAQRPTARTAVIVHGYKVQALGMIHIAYLYHHDMGFNILLPDLSAHGHSEGQFIGMGWNERHEVLRWVDVARNLFGDSVRVALHGISMGAATVMNVAGEPCPPCVRCVVEDCGYTSVWDEFAGEMRKQFGLPSFPLLHVTSALTRMWLGWSFGQAAPVRQVAHSRLPIFFIHGDCDDYVPTWMVRPLYAAAAGPKELWITAGCDHAQSYYHYPIEYTQKVATFVDKHM